MKYLSYLILSIVCVWFAGCSSDHLPPMTGDIIGNISLSSGRGQDLGDYSKVKVRLLGIDPVVEVTTDESGFWIMKNIPSGTYNVEYFLEGFEEFKQFSVQHVGGSVPTVPYLGTLELAQLGQQHKITKVESSVTSTSINFFITTIKPAGSNEGGAFCFMNLGIASPSKYKRVQIANTSDRIIQMQVGIETLKSIGFKSGETISFAFYAKTNFTMINYYDPILDLKIYPNRSNDGIELKLKMP